MATATIVVPKPYLRALKKAAESGEVKVVVLTNYSLRGVGPSLHLTAKGTYPLAMGVELFPESSEGKIPPVCLHIPVATVGELLKVKGKKLSLTVSVSPTGICHLTCGDWEHLIPKNFSPASNLSSLTMMALIKGEKKNSGEWGEFYTRSVGLAMELLDLIETHYLSGAASPTPMVNDMGREFFKVAWVDLDNGNLTLTF